VQAMLAEAQENATHWSTRALAEHLRVSATTGRSPPGTTRPARYTAARSCRCDEASPVLPSRIIAKRAKRGSSRCARVRLRLCPTPHRTPWMASPSLPLNQLRASRRQPSCAQWSAQWPGDARVASSAMVASLRCGGSATLCLLAAALSLAVTATERTSHRTRTTSCSCPWQCTPLSGRAARTACSWSPAAGRAAAARSPCGFSTPPSSPALRCLSQITRPSQV
jgi:hypothetical protein